MLGGAFPKRHHVDCGVIAIICKVSVLGRYNPLLHQQKSGHLSRHYIFIASCTMHFSSSVSCFFFQFYFVLLATING
jgi:hypothetical protein